MLARFLLKIVLNIERIHYRPSEREAETILSQKRDIKFFTGSKTLNSKIFWVILAIVETILQKKSPGNVNSLSKAYYSLYCTFYNVHCICGLYILCKKDTF